MQKAIVAHILKPVTKNTHHQNFEMVSNPNLTSYLTSIRHKTITTISMVANQGKTLRKGLKT